VPLLEQVLKRYPEKVKTVFKNFPIQSHKFAMPAAQAAMAAQYQGKFWPLHDALFANYNNLNEEKIQSLATDAKLDMKRLLKDRSSTEVKSIINRDISEARRIGVRGTPTIFINGRLLTNRSLEGFSQAIEAELKKR
jgi:protein-disulfide isomerase